MDTPLRILVAEDELGDILLLQRAFAKTGVNAPIYFARDGREVLQYLQGAPPFENPVEFPLPNLLLLDLNLPHVSGFEVLEWLRREPGISRLPVVVFSASERPQDISRAYALGANSYVFKPQDPDELVEIVAGLQNYWSSINAVPMERLQFPDRLVFA